jgi:hypothetical protein
MMKLFRREAEKSKPMGNLITCHDCGGFGYIAISGGEVILPPGWRMAWVRWKPLYICGDCAKKRRKLVFK